MKEELILKRINVSEQAEVIRTVLHKAVQHALWTHKRLGNSIAVWQDGQVVIIPADEIVLASEFADELE